MKLPFPFIQLPLLFDADKLLMEITALGSEAWRPHPQGFPGNSALTLITTDGDPGSDSLSGAMRPTPWLERCPYLMQVLHAMGATLGRTRLMRLEGQAEVTPHVDMDYYWRERVRVHVPIISQPAVRFECGDAHVHMATGECWIFDTWRVHRVLNPDDRPRIHLVADTVGGDRFWSLVAAGRAPGMPQDQWHPESIEAIAGDIPTLDYEAVNAPVVMSPWEVREHAAFMLGEAAPHPLLPTMHAIVLRFSKRWHALWSCYGESAAGHARYRQLLDTAWDELQGNGIWNIELKNGMKFARALHTNVFGVALALDAIDTAAETRAQPEPAQPAEPSTLGRDQIFDRPVFIVSPPRSGSTLLFETMMLAPRVHTIDGESHQLIEGVPGLGAAERGHDSNRLVAHDATAEIAHALRQRFVASVRDRNGQAPFELPLRMLEKTPKNALRIPFLAEVFPEAHFIYLRRDPCQVMGSMIDGWNSGLFRTYPHLPGWEGLPWSFLLVPEWRQLRGLPLAQIVASQWQSAARHILDDLAQLPPQYWTVLDYDNLVSDPQASIERLSDWAGYHWNQDISKGLPNSRATLTAPDPEKWRRHASQIEPQLPGLRDLIERMAAL